MNEEGGEDDVEILKWWKLNSPRFPILSRMARDILAMPVSTVASEAAFSTGGRTLDQFRSSLTPKVVQGLICGQDWLRAKLKNERDKVVNVEESLKELEDLEDDMQKNGTDESTIYVTDEDEDM